MAKKSILTMLVCALFSALAISCSKDDDSSNVNSQTSTINEELLGGWATLTGNDEIKELYVFYRQNTCLVRTYGDNGILWYFDGTYTVSKHYIDFDLQAFSNIFSFESFEKWGGVPSGVKRSMRLKYTINGDRLTLTNEKGGNVFYKVYDEEK